MAPDVSNIKPGSILLYQTPDDLVDWIITRTGPAAHCELYEGSGKSLASRNGIGVNRYDFRAEGLIGVLEPAKVDMAAFSAWFETVKGEAYDWSGLEGFLLGKVTEGPNELFCSAFIEFGFERQGNPLFNKLWPHGLITPTDYFKSALCKWVWADISQMPV